MTHDAHQAPGFGHDPHGGQGFERSGWDTPQDGGGVGEPIEIAWKEDHRGFVGLSFINFLLQIITLGIYSFWGKTEVRRRIWSSIRLQGEPVEYTGTGKELFFGFLIVAGFVLIPLFVFQGIFLPLLLGQAPLVAGILYALLIVGIFFLVAVGVYRAQRYRLSRTRWRGIRGALVGNSWAYGWTYLWTGLVGLITLGWAMPWRRVKLYRIVTEDMRFGDRPFRFTGTSGPLYKRYAITWAILVSVLVLPALLLWLFGVFESVMRAPEQSAGLIVGLILLAYIVYPIVFLIALAQYQSKAYNYLASETHFEGGTFNLQTTAGSLIGLIIGNFFIAALTFGILKPLVAARTARYFFERLSVDGLVPVHDILQGTDFGPGRGEGLGQAFDVDAF